MVKLSTDSEDIRGDLAALGVPRRFINVLVQLGIEKQTEQLAETLDNALELSHQAHGVGALERSSLEARVVELVRIEQDIDHARQVARGQGLDARALTVISGLIQSNPGDGGNHVVNRLVSYARAAGISLDDVPHMLSLIHI